MDLNHLSVFVTVARLGSFTAAAEQLGLQRSAVSRRVAALEEQLGVRLLHRTTRRVSATSAGQRLLDRASQPLEDLQRAVDDLPERGSTPAGELRITAPPDLGPRLLAPILGRLVERWPRLEPDLRLTNRMVDLEGEGFDVAIRGLTGRPEDSRLRALRLTQLTIGLFASKAYLSRHGQPETLADLADHTLVGSRQALSALPSVRRVLLDDLETARAFVVQGLGIAPLPSFLADTELTSGAVEPVVPSYAVASGALYALFPSSRERLPKVQVFRDALVEHFAGATMSP